MAGSTDLASRSRTRPAEIADEESEQTEEVIEAEELSLDVVFELLKNERRRLVLSRLQETEGGTTLSDLAEEIAAIENDKTIEALSSSERKRVYVGLYQCHLPKMDDADVVEFDRNRGTVERGPNADHLEEYVVEETVDRDWPMYYMSIAVGGGLLYGAAIAGAIPFAWASPLIGVALILGFVVCSAFHAYLRE